MKGGRDEYNGRAVDTLWLYDWRFEGLRLESIFFVTALIVHGLYRVVFCCVDVVEKQKSCCCWLAEPAYMAEYGICINSTAYRLMLCDGV
jgi:hypothetical protein